MTLIFQTPDFVTACIHTQYTHNYISDLSKKKKNYISVLAVPNISPFCNTAWVQTSEGSENIITAALNYSSGDIIEAGTVIARHGCWSMLKGGIVANVTTPAHIIFKVKMYSAHISKYIC